MTSTFKDLIQSPQFTFFIGKEAKPIVVHAAVLAATSPQLNALIHGGLEESEAQCARIEGIELDDFTRFCEYAYRGDYTVPPWEEILPRPSTSEEIHVSWKKKKKVQVKHGKASAEASAARPDEELPRAENPEEDVREPETENASPRFFSPRAPTPISRTPLRTEFESRHYLSNNTPKATILQNFNPQPNLNRHQNFTPVFLAHARLYCFANYRLITPLKQLTLDKLHRTLLQFKLYAERVQDIMELAKYAYSNPNLPSRSEDGTPEPLRKLVLDYIICEIDTVGKHEEFVKCMEQGGQFVGDFWGMARKYIVS